MKRVLDIPTRLDCSVKLTALRHAGQTLTEVDRDELLQKVRAGEFVKSLVIDAITYVQRDTHNRNYTRFKNAILAKVAKSFEDVPMLKDHAHGKFDARGGTIRKSKLDRSEDGDVRFLQTLELQKPWAIEAALDGTMDRFSISWISEKRPLCSLDNEPIFSKYFGGGDCDHLPGERVQFKGEEHVIEAVFIDGVGVETSAVSVPAVLGTGIEQIVASLSAMRAQKGTDMKELSQVATALGLDSGASLDDVIAESSKLTIALAAEKQAHEGVKTALREVREKADAERREQLAAGIEAEVERGIREGKFAPEHDEKGVRVESPLELAIRSAGKAGGVAAAKQVVDSLVRIHPVGLATPTGIDPPKNPSGGATDQQLEVWKKNGYSDDEIAELSKALN